MQYNHLLTMDRVYNPHQQPKHGFPQQHTQQTTAVHQQNQHHIQRQNQLLQQPSSFPPHPPPPPPPPLPPPQQHTHMQQRQAGNLLISIQQTNQHPHRGNHYRHQSMVNQNQEVYLEQQKAAVANMPTILLSRAVHLPPHPPPPPPSSRQAISVNEHPPTRKHISPFIPPLMSSKRDFEDVIDVSTSILRNSLPAVPTRNVDTTPDHLIQRSSLQHNYFNNTQFQYYEPTNLRKHASYLNNYIDHLELPHMHQIDSSTVANDTNSLVWHQQHHRVADECSVEQNTQEQYTDGVIQAILAAKDALEKPIEERNEHDILLIDNLCSLVHGFDAFPRSVRRALAAQTVLIVIDEKGKELIVHNEELDSFCVLIFGECEQLNENKNQTIRTYNVGDAFGVCEPTTETIRFLGHMITKCENCAFLCVKRDDFYTILTDPANYPNKEIMRHRDYTGNVVCVSQFSLDRKTMGLLWCYYMQSQPHKIVLPDRHMIIKATEACLLTALVDGYERVDPEYIDDFLLLFRVFMSWDQKDKDKKLPPGMIKLCLTLNKWLDHTESRDKVVKIVLTWLSSYYHDFELNTEFSYLFFRQLESRLHNLGMSNQLQLLHATMSTKSKTRHVTISRSSREQPLNFCIAGGYEKNCGIFVTQVVGSSSSQNDSPHDNFVNYLNLPDKLNALGLITTQRSRLNNSDSKIHSQLEYSNRISTQLRPGDQILEVNGTNFSAIRLLEAQKKLDQSTHLSLTVKYDPSAFHEMKALPEGRRKSSMSSISSVSPYPQNAQKFTFNMNEHNIRTIGDHSNPPNSPLFSTNANFKFKSIIKNAPKNDRSRFFNIFNSSKQFVRQIRDSTASGNIETASKTSDNISDDQSNEVDVSKTRQSNDLPFLKSKDKQLESGLSTIVRPDDLDTNTLLDGTSNSTNTSVNVLRVFNAANNDSRYLLIHEETTAREVVMVAVKEFNLSCGNNSNASLPVVGEKTVSSLNWHLYEVSVVPKSKTIKQKCLSEQTSRLAERASLSSRFYIKNSSIGPTKLDMGDESLVNEILKESPASVTLTSLNATLLAVELTLADFDKFRNIEPQQFVYDTFFDCSNEKHDNSLIINGSISSHDSASLKSSSSDGQDSSDSLHLLNKTRSIPKGWMKEYTKFADISNKEMFWVICEILNERNIGRRVKIVKQFVRVADVCSQLRNYNSMFAIISGLGHSCVARLRRTFEKLKPKYKNQLEKMRSLFDPSKNMLNYRSCLNQTQPPAIPLFPQIKKDLTFTKEGRSIFVRESNELSDDEESGFSQNTIKRKTGIDLLDTKSAIKTIPGVNRVMGNQVTSSQARSASCSNFNRSQKLQGSGSDSILINFAEIRQFTDRVKKVIYFSSMPYSNDLLTNTKENQRTQAQIKKMHEEWQMRKRIRHYMNQTLENTDLESADGCSSRVTAQPEAACDQVDGRLNKSSSIKHGITYDERYLYQRSLEVEPELNARPQYANHESSKITSTHANKSALPLTETVLHTQPIQLHLPPPQVTPILNITQQLHPRAADSSPTLSKSSSLSSCSSFSHQLPIHYPTRVNSNLASAVGKFGTESTESLRKLRALRENDEWRSSSCNSNSQQNNGLNRVATDGLGVLTRNLIPSRKFPPKHGK